MANMEPLSVSQWLVRINGLVKYFTKATAPKSAKAEAEYNDGRTGRTRTHLGFSKLDKVTLSAPFKLPEDKAVFDWYQKAWKDSERFEVSLQPVKADEAGTPIEGAPTILLLDCQLASFSYPEVDRSGTGIAMLVLEVVPEEVTTQ